MKVPTAPEGAQRAGRRLWRAVLNDYELATHELVLLEQAVHVADACQELQSLVHRDGAMIDSRANPALVELRQERILLARLLVALRVPLGAAEDEQPGRQQYRGTRGVYGIRGGAA